MNDYDGFEVTWNASVGGWWKVTMLHLASGRYGCRIRPTRRECEEAMRDLALWLADPDEWYRTLGER